MAPGASVGTIVAPLNPAAATPPEPATVMGPASSTEVIGSSRRLRALTTTWMVSPICTGVGVAETVANRPKAMLNTVPWL